MFFKPETILELLNLELKRLHRRLDYYDSSNRYNFHGTELIFKEINGILVMIEKLVSETKKECL